MGARTFVSVIVGLWFSALYLRDLHGDRIARAKVDTKLPLSSEDTDDVSDDTWWLTSISDNFPDMQFGVDDGVPVSSEGTDDVSDYTWRPTQILHFRLWNQPFLTYSSVWTTQSLCLQKTPH